MRSPTLLLVLGVAFAYGTPVAVAQDARKLTVSSNATVQAEPDAAVISFLVAGKGTTVNEARDSLDKKSNAIKIAITDLKLAAVKIDTTPAPVQPLVAAFAGPDGSQPVEGYHSQNHFTVTVSEKELKNLQKLVTQVGDLVVENGGVGLADERSPRIRFPRIGLPGVANPPEPPEKAAGPTVEWLCQAAGTARALAIKTALEDARANALVVAGSNALKEKEIQVQQAPAGPRVRYAYMSGTTDLNAGRVPIEVTVTVIFNY